MDVSESALGKGLFEGLAGGENRLSPGPSQPREAILRSAAPGPVILLGAPGVGKGTQSETLAEIWRIPKISTGEILRANVKCGTALGIQAEMIMQRGELVPDEVITEMVASRISVSDAGAGFILDGFPRTVKQAQWLDGHLAAHRHFAPLTVINLHMEPRKILQRIVYRKTCPCCQAVYNTRLRPPRQKGKCDRDGSALVQRSDDSIEVFQERLNAFKRETEPLIDYYRKHRRFTTIAADRPAPIVTKNIIELIAHKRIYPDGLRERSTQ